MSSKIWESMNFSRAVGMSCGAFAASAVMAGTAWAGSVQKDALEDGVPFRPASNTRFAADVGVRVHTFLEVIKPKLGRGNLPGFTGGPPVTGTGVETPASLECVYKFTAIVDGCNPNLVTTEATGGTNVIAIVDAYDYVDATSDLNTYSAQFGLPAPSASNFEKVYATGTKPASSSGTGWDLEAALDIEMAHGLAPKAKVFLVEAASSATSDMLFAVGVAANIVQAAGGGEVSMSFGGTEFSGESADDSTFTG